MLLCVTANHRNTPFETLERLSVDAHDLARRAREASTHVRGAVAVTTCNRVELYLDIDGSPITAHTEARKAFQRALLDMAGPEASAATEHAQLLDDAAAVHHLFSVCAGLESVAVGEEEIVGQVLDEEEREETDTLGGLVFMLAGRVPARGEVLRHDSGIEFEVTDVDPRRIKRLRIRNLPRTPQSMPAEASGK